jgi:hypothetical protein
MKDGKYRLCGLAQENTRTQGWIEERGAKLGARVEIEELGGFWEVTGVGDTVLSKAEMKEKEARSRQSFTALKSYRGNK